MSKHVYNDIFELKPKKLPKRVPVTVSLAESLIKKLDCLRGNKTTRPEIIRQMVEHCLSEIK